MSSYYSYLPCCKEVVVIVVQDLNIIMGSEIANQQHSFASEH